MNLSKFIIKRLIFSVFTIFGLSIMIFIIARVVPGDPARMALGPRAPDEVVQQLRAQMHLDKTMPEQYIYWITDVFKGDLGKSLVTRMPVLEDIKEYLPATLELALHGAIFMIVFSVLLGTISAQYKNTTTDNVIRLISYFGVAMPAFVIAIFFVLLFGYNWTILPVIGRLSTGTSAPKVITGLITIDSLIQGNFGAYWDALKHLILPSIALAWPHIFQDARITRSAMVENMYKDYLFAERGYGIPEKIIMFKYLLKPSLIPTVSVMGIEFGTLVSNAFLVEMVFNWPGISKYSVNAMMGKDLSAISSVILMFGLIFIIANIIVDIIVVFLDPRIRLRVN